MSYKIYCNENDFPRIANYGPSWGDRDNGDGYVTGSLEELERNCKVWAKRSGGAFYYSERSVPSWILNSTHFTDQTKSVNS